MNEEPLQQLSPSSQGSVTRWLHDLQAGDPSAAQQLWERYFRRLVGLARTRLRRAARRVADEEDVALSAFDSFCRNAENGRFPELADRHGLWRLLVVLTARKAAHQVRDQARLKRGGGAQQVTDESGREDEESVLEGILSREPDPAFAAQVAEEFQANLASLQNPELESVALWRMEGYTVEEIAGRLGCVPRSVKRKLQVIRAIWQKKEAT
jgi:DNA-directed RNA polymerase specialized sigma24 family protein